MHLPTCSFPIPFSPNPHLPDGHRSQRAAFGFRSGTAKPRQMRRARDKCTKPTGAQGCTHHGATHAVTAEPPQATHTSQGLPRGPQNTQPPHKQTHSHRQRSLRRPAPAPQPPPRSAPDNPTFRLKNGLAGTKTTTTIINNNEIRRRNRAIPPTQASPLPASARSPAGGRRVEAMGRRPWGGGGTAPGGQGAGRGRGDVAGSPPSLSPPQTCGVVVWCFLSATGPPPREAKFCLRSNHDV